MARVSQRAAVLQESAIRKLDLTMREHPGVRFYRVNIGQPDVPTPEPLRQALRDGVPEVVAYGPASGLPALREAAAGYLSRFVETAPPLTADDVVVTTGGSEALLFAFTAVCDPGDALLVPEPYYTNYNGFATVAGVSVHAVPTRLSDGFAFPSDAELDAAWTPRTRVLVFSNPGNPTGAVYGRADLERALAWARRRDVFVVADEVYRRIAFQGAAPSMLSLDDPDGRVLVVDSLSKAWSACGLRVGFLASRNAEVMEKIERLGQARLGPQPLAQAGALAALALDEGYYDEVREIYARRVRAAHEALAAIPGVETHEPAGAFYLMAELPVDDADTFARWMVTTFRHEGASVVLAPGTGFYADPERGRRQVRIAAVLAEEDLRRAMELLRRGLEAYPGRAGSRG